MLAVKNLTWFYQNNFFQSSKTQPLIRRRIKVNRKKEQGTYELKILIAFKLKNKE
jgi:hypothetical protein